MNAIAFQQWTDTRAGAAARPQLPLWLVGSVLFHALLIALLLLGPDWRPMHLADRVVQDRPAVEVVMTRLVRAATPTPSEEDIATDRPDNALPPPVRRIDTAPSELEARPDSPLAAGLQPIDPAAIREYLKRNADKNNIADAGLGYSWATCSLLSPERRVMEPACDGLLLSTPPNDPTGVAVLMTPDAETLAAIARINPPRTAQDEADALGTRDTNTDRAFRNEGDSYYGPRPWE